MPQDLHAKVAAYVTSQNDDESMKKENHVNVKVGRNNIFRHLHRDTITPKMFGKYQAEVRHLSHA